MCGTGKRRVERNDMILGRDIGIDLGTTSVLLSTRGKGVIMREPAVVAMDKNTGRLLNVGMAAQRMLGRTPGNIVAIRPMHEGAISVVPPPISITI